MATRLVTAADIAAVRALDNGALAEMAADFGVHVNAYTLAEWQAFRASGLHKCLAYVRSGQVRGFMLVLRTPTASFNGISLNGWQIVRIVTDKNLTAAQRLAGFDEVRRFGAGLVVSGGNPSHIIWGKVKATGQFNSHLVSLGYNRVIAGQAIDTRTPQPDIEIDGEFYPQSDLVTYRDTVALFYAPASVVAV